MNYYTDHRSFQDIWKMRRTEVPVYSDHLPVLNYFKCGNGVELYIGTYNTGNKFHSKANCSAKGPDGRGLFSNNPEDLDENDKLYLERKHQQLHYILGLITQGNLDAFFLQEIDFLTLPVSRDLKIWFIHQLQSYGYELVMSNSRMNANPQAIIYKKQTLTLIRGSLSAHILNDAQYPKNTLFEALFIHHESGEKVCLSTLHLSYSQNLKNKIKNHTKWRARQGYTCIAGGDTNHIPKHLPGINGDSSHATCYDIREKDNKLTTRHEDTNISKAYDSFAGCAPDNHVLEMIEGPRHYFYCQDGQVGVAKRNYHIRTVSLPGKPLETQLNTHARKSVQASQCKSMGLFSGKPASKSKVANTTQKYKTNQSRRITAVQTSFIQRYGLAVYQIFDAIYGEHYSPENSTNSMQNTEQVSAFRLGLLDILILPLISQMLAKKTYNKIKKETNGNFKDMTTLQLLGGFAVAVIVLAIEASRLILSLAVTIPLALTVAPIITIKDKCFEEEHVACSYGV